MKVVEYGPHPKESVEGVEMVDVLSDTEKKI